MTDIGMVRMLEERDQELGRLRDAMRSILAATHIPPHKADDLVFLRASCTIAQSYARSALCLSR